MRHAVDVPQEPAFSRYNFSSGLSTCGRTTTSHIGGRWSLFTPFFLLLKTCSPSLCLVCFVNFTRTLKGLGSTSDASRLPLLLAPYQSFLISVSLLPSSSFIYNALTATPSGPAGLAATASILLVQCRGVALPSLRLSFEASPLLLFLLHILCVLMIDYWLLLLSSTRKSISIGYVTSCIFVCSVSRDTRSPS